MVKYHVDYAGNAGVCKARKNCPFGGDIVEDHYASAEAARMSYELDNREARHVMPEKVVDFFVEVGPRQLPNRTYVTLSQVMHWGQWSPHDLRIGQTVITEELDSLERRRAGGEHFTPDQELGESGYTVNELETWRDFFAQVLETRKQEDAQLIKEKYPEDYS